MPDDLNRKRPQDSNKINVNQPWEIEYWTKKLGVTKEELGEAVKAVGPSVTDVKRYLGI
ncbi:MAG: DUF3606 domain-containing protein [Desulfarculaceae bacterium]|jgi:hypothetical protein